MGEANCISSLGNVQLELGNEDEAVAAWQTAYSQYLGLKLPDDAASVLVSQTTLYDRKRDYTRSLELHTQALALAPANPLWYCSRASCFIGLKEAAAAEADLHTAAELQPDHPSMVLHRGDLALLTRDAVAAAEYYRRFIERLPEANNGYLGLSQALLMVGEPGHAFELLTIFLARTYAPSDTDDALYELESNRKVWPDVDGWEEAIEMLRKWQQEHQGS